MRRLLLVSTAIAGVAVLSSPASAAVKMDVGGFFRGYGIYADNNDLAATNLYTTAFRRDTEVHVNGETTLDNGLTVGGHTELKTGNGANTVATDEVYGYASGGWGRVNLGVEDGAAYLLQVAAPSADSNIDGLRTNISAITPRTTQLFGAAGAGINVLQNSSLLNPGKSLDYQDADSRYTDRVTLLTPKYNGFQAGASYAPQPGFASNTGVMVSQTGVVGTHTAGATVAASTDIAGTFDNLWEGGARWDGEYQGFGISAGAGYSHSDAMLKPTAAAVTALATVNSWFLNDGVESYNGGLDLTWSGFSLGGNYMQAKTSRITNADQGVTNVAVSGDITQDTWVVGAGWDNGPYHLGASYLDQETNYDSLGAVALASDITSTKYHNTKGTVGAGYTFGPGMTFRGSVAWGDLKASGNSGITAGTAYTSAANNRYTQVGIGADLQF